MSPKQNKLKHRSIKSVKDRPANLNELNSTTPGARISAACKACKKRKTKCSGHPPPCQMCEQFNTLCVIDLTLDMRRRTAVQRTIDESRTLQDTLSNIIDVLHRADWTKIQDLVAQSQRSDKPDELMQILQARFQQKKDRDSQRTNDQIKEELEESTQIGSEKEDETETSSGSFVAPGLPRKRLLSVQEDAGSRSSINPRQHGSAGEQEVESLMSRYLPLISKLRTAADSEATHMLHDFGTSFVTTDVAALNLFEHRYSQPSLRLQTEQKWRSATSSEANSLDRTNWHTPMELTNPEIQKPIARSATHTTAAFVRSDAASGQMFASESRTTKSSQTSLSDIYVRTMKTSSPEETSEEASEEASEEVSEEFQTHPAMYGSMQVNKTSQVVEMFGDLRAVGGSNSQQLQASPQESVVQSFATIPVYLIQSRLRLEESLLSKVFTGFRNAARQMIATGTPPSEIIDGSDVVVDIFFRERLPTDTFTCASWACELYRSFSEIPDIVRLGCIFLLARLMRWMIFPTPETFAEVPECQRPTPTQCFVPHMPAVDLHPMPAFRDMLCNGPQDWIASMTLTSVSCNWLFGIEKALESDPTSSSIRISQPFAEHVAKSENWSFNSNIFALYPELEGKVRIKDDQPPIHLRRDVA